MIKLGLEATSLCTPNRSGIANYTYNLVDSLLNEPNFRNEFDLKLLYKLSRYKKRNFRYIPFENSTQWHYKNILPFNKGFDIIHAADNILIDWKKPKQIVTIYDLAIFQKENNIEGYTTSEFKEKSFKYLSNVAKQADAIISISESTKKNFLELFEYKPENIFVTHLGLRLNNKAVKSENVLMKLNIQTRKYFLFTGMISIRKNIINLIKAYKESGLTGEYKLILAGEMSMGHDKIVSEIEKNNLQQNVILSGFVSDAELAELYKNSKAFLFPTFYEGFGFPIIEAMSYGIPVVIGDRGAAPEVAGNHAIQVSPFDVDSISEGIKKVITVSETQITAAKKHSEQFTWSRCAQQTIDVYNSVLGK